MLIEDVIGGAEARLAGLGECAGREVFFHAGQQAFINAAVHFRLCRIERIAAAIVERHGVGAEAPLEFLVDVEDLFLILLHYRGQGMNDKVAITTTQRREGIQRPKHAAIGLLLAANAIVLFLVGVIDAEVQMKAHCRCGGKRLFQNLHGSLGVLTVGRHVDIRNLVGLGGGKQDVRQISPQKRLAAPMKRL